MSAGGPQRRRTGESGDDDSGPDDGSGANGDRDSDGGTTSNDGGSGGGGGDGAASTTASGPQETRPGPSGGSGGGGGGGGGGDAGGADESDDAQSGAPGDGPQPTRPGPGGSGTGGGESSDGTTGGDGGGSRSGTGGDESGGGDLPDDSVTRVRPSPTGDNDGGDSAGGRDGDADLPDDSVTRQRPSPTGRSDSDTDDDTGRDAPSAGDTPRGRPAPRDASGTPQPQDGTGDAEDDSDWQPDDQYWNDPDESSTTRGEPAGERARPAIDESPEIDTSAVGSLDDTERERARELAGEVAAENDGLEPGDVRLTATAGGGFEYAGVTDEGRRDMARHSAAAGDDDLDPEDVTVTETSDGELETQVAEDARREQAAAALDDQYPDVDITAEDIESVEQTEDGLDVVFSEAGREDVIEQDYRDRGAADADVEIWGEETVEGRMGDGRLDAGGTTASGTSGSPSVEEETQMDVDVEWPDQPSGAVATPGDGPDQRPADEGEPLPSVEERVEAQLERGGERDVEVEQQADGSFVVTDSEGGASGPVETPGSGPDQRPAGDGESLPSAEARVEARIARGREDLDPEDVDARQTADGFEATVTRSEQTAAAREDLARQVDEEFPNADLEAGEDFTISEVETEEGEVRLDAELTDAGRREIARENAPLQGTPLEAVTEWGAGVNYAYEELRRGIRGGIGDITPDQVPVEDSAADRALDWAGSQLPGTEEFVPNAVPAEDSAADRAIDWASDRTPDVGPIAPDQIPAEDSAADRAIDWASDRAPDAGEVTPDQIPVEDSAADRAIDWASDRTPDVGPITPSQIPAEDSAADRAIDWASDRAPGADEVTPDQIPAEDSAVDRAVDETRRRSEPVVDIDGPSSGEVLAGAGAAVAAPEPTSSVSGAAVGAATLAGLGVASLVQDPDETETTASATVAGQSEIPAQEDLSEDQSEIPASDTPPQQQSEVDVSDRESFRPEEIGVPRDAVERGEAEIQGGEYNPETGEIEIPADAANAVSEYRYEEDEEEAEEDEEEEGEETEEDEEDVVVEVPPDFIPDEEQTIGGETEDAADQQQAQDQQQQQEQQEAVEQAQGDEFADPSEQAEDGEVEFPEQGQRQSQQDEFIDPGEGVASGGFGDQLSPDEEAETAGPDTAVDAEELFENVGGSGGGEPAAPAVPGLDEQQDQLDWLDEQEDVGVDEFEAQATEEGADAAETVDSVLDDGLDDWTGATPDQTTTPDLTQTPDITDSTTSTSRTPTSGTPTSGTPTTSNPPTRPPNNGSPRRPPRIPDLEFDSSDEAVDEDLFEVDSETFDTGVVQSFDELDGNWQRASEEDGGEDPLSALDDLL